MKVFAEIITVGDELLIGQVVDTNSAWMGKQLNQHGIGVKRITSIRDQADEITAAVDAALKEVDIVLVTGGLGPTKDDITKLSLCRYFKTELVFDEAVYQNIKRILAGRIPMNQQNKSMAYVPKNCTVIQNPVGSASISWFDWQGKVLVSMPGVPQEMKAVMEQEVLPRLSQRFDTDYILHESFTVKNYAESVLAETLEAWEDQLPSSLSLAYLPTPGVMRLRLTAQGPDRTVLEQELKAAEAGLYQILKQDVFVEEDKALAEQLGDWLRRKNLTLATAESCTGGKMAAKIVAIPACSSYFQGAIVAYHNQVKINQLGVQASTLEAHGAVSEETAREMVEGVCKELQADCGIASTGIAGPTGAVPGKPVGTVWLAVKCQEKLRTRKLDYNHGREMNIERACNQGFLMLMEMLQEQK